MLFQRFSATSAVRSALKSFASTGAGAVCVLLLILTASNAVFAQNFPFRADGGRRAWNASPRNAWNETPTGIPSRVETSEPSKPSRPAAPPAVDVSANRVEAGIPSRLEGTDATIPNAPRRPDVRETATQETGWAVSGANAQEGSGQAGRNGGNAQNGQNAQNERNGQNGAARGGTAPSVCVSLPFARKATREELERWRASEKGTLVAIPRVNFLRNPKEEGEATDAAPTGIDAATENVATRDAVEAPSTESVASPIAANVPKILNLPSAPVDGEFIVFTLSNLPPDEAALLRDAEDGRWDEIDLFDAALIAEGLTARERRAPQREKFERFAAELATLTERETDPLEKTKIVYGYLHDVVLTEKYNLNCSSLVASLETGVFNCVSATALFNCFAARSGLEVAALETTGHAKSRVKFADSFLDLETTCSSWDRLPDKIRAYSQPRRAAVGENGNDDETTATLQNVSFERRVADVDAEAGTTTFDAETSTPDAPLGYSYTRTRKPMREIGDVELVATIYYNVGVDFYQKERFEEAIVAYVKAARLAPNNPTILGNLKATLNNWAIQIAMKDRDFERAIQVAEQGLLLDPNFPEYKMNLPIFFHRWVDRLALENRWDEAKRVEREYLKRFPKPTPQ
ncbi:MAG: tetratricopeptide repeat protein [Thermoguttaceae bacterium]|nr:tetratricopeptide repeat protein [Thermoguttaceae bacterium]